MRNSNHRAGRASSPKPSGHRIITRNALFLVILGTALLGLGSDGLAESRSAASHGARGEKALFRDRHGIRADLAIIHLNHEAQISRPLPDPRCPTSSRLILRTDRHPERVISLPCGNWGPFGTGFRYHDRSMAAGGVHQIKLMWRRRHGGQLRVRLRGDNYGPHAVSGPLLFTELTLVIGETEYCGRFEQPPGRILVNRAAHVVFHGPSTACSALPATASPTPFPSSTPSPTPTPEPHDTPSPTHTSTATATDSHTITPTPLPPIVQILSPTGGTIVRSSPIEVSGEASNADNIEVNGVTAAVDRDTFTAAAISLTHGNNTITATASGPGGTASDSVSVILNTAPVADAGADRSVTVGTTVTLDASASSDADGDPLTHQWILTGSPAGSTATLSHSSTVTPSLEIERAGSYVLGLVVNDGFENGATDTVTISTVNTPPEADAGDDQAHPLGAIARLDGRRSSDADGDALAHQWQIVSRPAGSRGVPSDPIAAQPTIVLDRPGTYTVRLVVNDGQIDSEPDTVTLSTINSRPVADAGADHHTPLGATLTLDGTGSHDPDGDPLAHQWSILLMPATSAAALTDMSSPAPSIAIDRAGTYVLALVVNDGQIASTPDTTVITTVNTPPVADAGADQEVLAGTAVTLDGSASFDPDGDPLEYFWSFATVPPGSIATLSSDAAAAPTFAPDLPGTYVAELVVHDGNLPSAADSTVVSVRDPAREGAELDQDGDGFTPAEGDCNDGDPAVHPDAEEIPDNGVDEDCDGRDRNDLAVVLETGTPEVSVGTSFTVQIVVNGLEDVIPEQIAAAFDLDVLYDPALLVLDGVDLGTALDPSLHAIDTATPGVIDLRELSFQNDPSLQSIHPSTVLLATLHFTAAATGIGTIELDPDPHFGRDVKGLDARPLPADLTGASLVVTVTQ